MPLTFALVEAASTFPFLTLCVTSPKQLCISLSTALFQSKKSQDSQVFLLRELFNAFDDIAPVLLWDKRSWIEKQSQHMVKHWINIVERKTFFVALCFFLVFCVLLDCYNILSLYFQRVPVVALKAWDTTISIMPIILHVKFGSVVPSMRMMNFVHKFLCSDIQLCNSSIRLSDLHYNGRWDYQQYRSER